MDTLVCNNTEPPASMGAGYPPRPVDTIIVMLSFFSIIGSTGNALVLYVYTRKRNKLPSTIFIISLAGTDMSVCIMVMPYTMIVESMDYEIIYDILCKVYLFLITSNVPFSAFIMVAIAVDRYICICHPHMHLMDARRAKIVLLSLLVLSMVLGLITALAYGVYLYKMSIPPDLDVVGNNTMLSINETTLSSLCYNSSLIEQLECSDPFSNQTSCKEAFDGEPVVTYTGICFPNQLIFSTVFRKTYQKLYAGMFLVAFIVVFVLYILIYKSVLERRTKKMRMRRKTQLSLYRETTMTDVQFSENGECPGKFNRNESRKAMMDRDGCIKEKYWLANIRTALMLFVVTLVFIVAFLPSWLMAHRVVQFNPVVFYLYFAYNVSNPIIYAFMNPAFRRELRDLLSCRGCKQT